MIIVAGSLRIAPERRAAYLEDCAGVVASARRTGGCLDFALSPDPLDPGRINVFERWASAAALGRFRGSGPDDGQRDALEAIDVDEYAVSPGG